MSSREARGRGVESTGGAYLTESSTAPGKAGAEIEASGAGKDSVKETEAVSTSVSGGVVNSQETEISELRDLLRKAEARADKAEKMSVTAASRAGKEVVKEVPVEVIREIIKKVEVQVQVPVEVEKKVETIREVVVTKEVPVEIVREVEVVKQVCVCVCFLC